MKFDWIRVIVYTVIVFLALLLALIVAFPAIFEDLSVCGQDRFVGINSVSKDYNRDELISKIKQNRPAAPILLPTKLMVAANMTAKAVIEAGFYPQVDRDSGKDNGYSLVLFDHREFISGGGQLGGIYVTIKSLKPDDSDYEINDKVLLSNGISGTLHLHSKSCASSYVSFLYKGYIFQIDPDIKEEDMVTFAKMFTDQIKQ